MKKILTLFCSFLLVVASFSGCTTASPEEPVQALMEATKQLDFETIKSVVNPEASSTSSENPLEMEEYAFIFDALKEYAQKMEYDVQEATIDGDSAQVPVQVTYVDASTLIGEVITETLQQGMVQVFSGKEMTQEETNQMILDIFSQKKDTVGENTAETTLTFTCQKENGTWKITGVDQTAYLDVLTANMWSAFVSLSESFGS
mgnify:CR=1 FL=1